MIYWGSGLETRVKHTHTLPVSPLVLGPPVRGVRHFLSLSAAFSDILIGLVFKGPVLPLLFTPIVNLYNAVKLCFTHVGYTISLLQRVDQTRQDKATRGQSEAIGGHLLSPLMQSQCNSTRKGLGTTLNGVWESDLATPSPHFTALSFVFGVVISWLRSDGWYVTTFEHEVSSY